MTEKEIIESLTIGKQKSISPRSIELQYPDFYDKIHLIEGDVIWRAKLYMYVNGIESVPKCVCGNDCTFLKFGRGFTKTCSKACANVSEDRIKNIQKTNLVKYGVKAPIQNKEIKEKIKKTTYERYGVDNVLKSDDFREKGKETNLKKYGKGSFSKTKEFKEKLNNTYQKKYGKDYGFQADEIKEKIKQTNIEKYGVENYAQLDNARMKDHNYRKIHYKIAQHPNYVNYISDGTSLFKCDCGMDHTFEINSTNNFYHRFSNNIPLCTVCYPISDHKSLKEKMLLEYIQSIYDGEVISGYRDRLEIDVYLPELNIGFEFNGTYWHSDKFKNESYHTDKVEYFKEKGIDIIYVWENDWDNNILGIKEEVLTIINNNKERISKSI